MVDKSNFNPKDGLSFERLEDGDGSVCVTIIDKNNEVTCIELDADVWVSVVASVCGAGENGDTLRRAENFHAFGRDEAPTNI